MSQTIRTPKLTRRRLLGHGAAAGAVLAGAPFIGRSAHALASELRILFPGATWQEYFQKTFTTPFSEANKVQMVWKTGVRWGPLLIAQRRRPQWDLAHMNQTEAAQMGSISGILTEFTDDLLPNLKDVHPSFKYQYAAGKVHTPYGLSVNTKRFTKPVTSWLDMWDPAFAGKVAFPDWAWVGEEVFHAINHVLGGNEENIDPGIAKFKELFKINKAVTISTNEQAIQMFANEEIWIAPMFSARSDQAKAKGAPVEFVLPKEGGLSWIWQTGIIAGRPKDSIETAAKLVNDTLDAEKQIAFSRLTGYPPTNIKAIKNLPPDLKHLELSDADLEGYGKLQRTFDYMAQFALKDANSERWKKEVLAA